ncbi:MAG TPA: lysophospholipid acyltransferase family protein [Thermodesulfobacteriota bacterium]|nr:lysophospholipid acyltransferase family protein [Thermodesulfobacteriota bacterium]
MGTIRTLACYFLLAVTTVILGTAAIVISLFDASGNTPHLVARLWGRIQLRTTGTEVKVSGFEHISPGRSYILASNHLSAFDIFAYLGYLPMQFRWVAKAELFRTPFMGWAMKRIGYIAIDRGSPKKAYRSMLAAAEAVKRGVSVMIFPEGTRSPDGRLQDFKKGLFLVALKSNAPILPITIQGTAEILPKGDWRVRPGKVRIAIAPAVETTGFSPEKEAELSLRIRAVIESNLSNFPGAD